MAICSFPILNKYIHYFSRNRIYLRCDFDEDTYYQKCISSLFHCEWYLHTFSTSIIRQRSPFCWIFRQHHHHSIALRARHHIITYFPLGPSSFVAAFIVFCVCKGAKCWVYMERHNIININRHRATRKKYFCQSTRTKSALYSFHPAHAKQFVNAVRTQNHYHSFHFPAMGIFVFFMCPGLFYMPIHIIVSYLTKNVYTYPYTQN